MFNIIWGLVVLFSELNLVLWGENMIGLRQWFSCSMYQKHPGGLIKKDC